MSDFSVGYKKPPVNSRFQKGRSGNPKGRPAGSRGFNSIMEDVFSRRVPITVNGKEEKVTMMEAIAVRLAQKAIAGDSRAMQVVLGWAKSRPEDEHSKFDPELQELFLLTKQYTDQEILDFGFIPADHITYLRHTFKLYEAHMKGEDIPQDEWSQVRFMTDKEITQIFDAVLQDHYRKHPPVSFIDLEDFEMFQKLTRKQRSAILAMS